MDISRFNGLRSDSDVCPFLLSLLDSCNLGNSESGENAQQNRRSRRIELPSGVRRKRGHLHEDQFCKCRSCACVDRSSNSAHNRKGGATAKRKFLALDQFQQLGHGQIRLEQRLWRILGIGIKFGSSSAIHRKPRGTSSRAHVRGGVTRVH
jgi:hypothetical protein